MKTQCEICNRPVEGHLQAQKKKLCFSCLTAEVTDSGALPTFNLKQKPVHGSCGVCDADTSGPDLLPSPWGYICRQCGDLCETQTGVPWELVKISAQKEWLVKANSRVIGPFSTGEIETQLRQNQIVPVDEIQKPGLGRWRFIRDEELFRPLLNELKNRQVQKGDKEETTASGTESQGITETVDIVDRPFVRTDKLLEGVSLKSEREARYAESGNSRDLLRSYASQDDSRVQRELQLKSQGRIWISLIILLIAGTVAALKIIHPGNGTQVKNQSFQAVMEVGLRAEKVGDFARAESAFAEARTMKPNDGELLLHLAPLTLLFSHGTLQSQRMFKEILETQTGVNYQKAAHLGLGLISLLSSDYDSAKESFNNALKLDPDYLPAIANRGIASFFKNELGSANADLIKALSNSNSNDGAVVIALADVAISGTDESGVQDQLVRAHQKLDAYLTNMHDYEQEVLVTDARVLSLMKGNEGVAGQARTPRELMAQRLSAFLDVDPEKSDLHLRDWGIYRERASWGLLYDSFKKVAQHLPSGPRLTAATGFAQFRGGEKLDGAHTIEQALTQAPHDPQIMALAGWVELKLGRREAGMANIRQASLTTSPVSLPHVLMARLCQEEKDFECAKKQWDQALDMNRRSIEALVGLANVEWARKNVEGATSWLRQAQAMDPNYIPLLKLNQEIQTAKGSD